MSKKLLAAGIVRDFEFDCMESLELYLQRLKQESIAHTVIETYERSDGSVVSRILSQFGNYSLVQLFD